MSELVEGGRLGGRYVLEERLGLGGMGEVWLAELEGAGAFRRRVVLKVLAPERRGDARLAAMLADEARLVGLLHHPGIVSALDYLETVDHGPVFVIEYVDGASLRTALRLARKHNALLPENLAVHLGVQVAYALHAAHTAVGRSGEPLSVVHRDVSPDNILLSRSGAVYLGDFGVARAASNTEQTAPGHGPKGKRGYMPPEQALGNQLLGPPADIFALGRVISEAADVACGPALREVLDKATQEKPKDRYQTAAEFAAALAKAVPAPPEPQTALALWLHAAAPEALVARKTAGGATPIQSEPPPAGRPSQSGLQRIAPTPELFARVPPPRRMAMRIIASVAALVMLLVPIALIFGAKTGSTQRLFTALAEDLSSHGDLRVQSRPEQAEVYVDGQLRGVTPLLVELPPGMHAVRVGSTRLEKWRAAQVLVRENVEHRLDIDLSE